MVQKIEAPISEQVTNTLQSQSNEKLLLSQKPCPDTCYYRQNATRVIANSWVLLRKEQ